MKKAVLIFTMAIMVIATSTFSAFSQDKPKPKKDTVNMDTHAKPTQYYAVEDEKPAAKSSKLGVPEIAIIAGIVIIVIGGIVFFSMRKKNK